jgi:hypothetical protein
MKVYIASSWKNQHAVELVTEWLRSRGHEVLSFVENNHGENTKGMPFDEWCMSPRGQQSFVYDTQGATKSDLVIYIGPSGCDAWAEVGAAWAAGVPIIAMMSKGEQVGLMRRMARWVANIRELREAVEEATPTHELNSATP